MPSTSTPLSTWARPQNAGAGRPHSRARIAPARPGRRHRPAHPLRRRPSTPSARRALVLHRPLRLPPPRSL
jgi:hypothetical protein